MTIPKKLDKKEVLREITLFYKRYEMVPDGHILSFIFGTTKPTIYRKLDQLEKDGKLIRIASNKYKNSYKLLIK